MSPPSGSSRKQAPSVTGLSVPRAVIDLLPLVALGVVFISSDDRFTFIDDEATTLNAATQPFRAILAAFRSGAGGHPQPPLHDLLLHIWLSLTGGAPALLRLPSVIFFLAGVWVLSRATSLIGGEPSGTSMIWLAALWPYGFQYARLANGYSFSFLLIAALTWAYLRHATAPSGPAWALVCLLAIPLVWTTDFGWVLLVLLVVEELIRNRGHEGAASRLAIAAALLAITSVPLWRTLLDAARHAIGSHPSWRAAAFNGAYKLYVLEVSESVAPWYWKFGVPAMLAVAASLVLMFIAIRSQALRFLIYGMLLLAFMAVIGTLTTESLLLVAPWFLLPAAVVIGTTHTHLWRRLMALSLAAAAGIGWYGILDRTYYATPTFTEPWGNLAVEAGSAARQSGVVIGNDPSFFLYLTYGLRVPSSTPWRFVGSLPYRVHDQQIWGPDDWQAAGHPLGPSVLWVAEMPESGSMEQTGDWLDRNCGDRIDRRLARDSSYAWKQRFLGESTASPWLIEVRQYSCGPNNTTSSPPPSAPPPAEPPH